MAHADHDHGPAGAEHAHGGEDPHAKHEEFPRVLTTKLIAEAVDRDEARVRTRQRIQAFLVGIAVTFLALGMPSSVLIGRTMHVVPMDEYFYTGHPGWAHCDPVPYFAVRALRALTGASRERCWFLVSALALGACAWSWTSFGFRRGWSPALVLPTVAAVVATPLYWLAGTTPGTAAVSMFGATLLFLALDARADRPWRSAAWGAVAWVLATLMSVSNLLLWPAFLLHVAVRHGRRAPAVLLVPFAALGVLFGAHDALGVIRFGDPYFLPALLHQSYGCSTTDATIPAGAGTYALLAGGAWIGVGTALIVLLTTRKRSVWWLVFAVLPSLMQWFGGGWLREIPFVELAPIALVGLLELGSRWKPAPWVSLAVGLAAFGLVPRLDYDRAWREAVETGLEPTDVVLVDDPRHHYLLVERYGLRCLRWRAGDEFWLADPQPSAFEIVNAAVQRELDAGHRIVLDPGYGERELGNYVNGLYRLTPEELADLRRRAAVVLPTTNR